MKRPRIKFVKNYSPAGRYVRFLRYRNGVTLRLFSYGIHVWIA